MAQVAIYQLKLCLTTRTPEDSHQKKRGMKLVLLKRRRWSTLFNVHSTIFLFKLYDNFIKSTLLFSIFISYRYAILLLLPFDSYVILTASVVTNIHDHIELSHSNICCQAYSWLLTLTVAVSLQCRQRQLTLVLRNVWKYCIIGYLL